MNLLRDELAEETLGREGFLEIVGHLEPAGHYLIGGWVSRSAQLRLEEAVTAVFERGSYGASGELLFYPRRDLGDRGFGFILIFPALDQQLGRLLRLEFDRLGWEVCPVGGGIRELSSEAAADRAASVLESCSDAPNALSLRTLLAKRRSGEGHLDLSGYHAPSKGWFVLGWVSRNWILTAGDAPIEAVVYFERGARVVVPPICYYHREDIEGRGQGIVMHLAAGDVDLGALLAVTLCSGNAVVLMRTGSASTTVDSGSVATAVSGSLVTAVAGVNRKKLQALAARTFYDGHDTLDSLGGAVLMHVDETIFCPLDSIVLAGWLLAKPGIVKAIRFCCEGKSVALDTASDFLWTDRNDVIVAVGAERGFTDQRCGFIARIPLNAQSASGVHLEIETVEGDLVFKNIPAGRLDGMAAIKRILESFHSEYIDVDRIYDRIIGPAVNALNSKRLETPPAVSELSFGRQPLSPRHALIVPLYGRIDFLEIQMAMFATQGGLDNTEILYVLDDPPRAREAKFLAASVHERFRVPFRLLCLSQNVGFAPANNIGARESKAPYLCFMNSDVFPKSAGWLNALVARLETDESMGVVGPLLLFEDESVQHQGIYFEKLQRLGDWSFPQHHRKGLRPPESDDLVHKIAITGACMLMRRETFFACGGFDEHFVVGDFEDTDLCLKLRQMGLTAAVDLATRMYHLERKSQETSANLWRMNVTVHNAWIHQRRWSEILEGLGDSV